jgi:hypothetical protein
MQNDEKQIALKFDNGKPGMDLLPVEAKRAIAEVFDFGAKKYARHNWRNGFNYSRLIAACERHLDAFNDGEDLDPESGKSHLAHAGCDLMMLLESVIKGYGTDDRHHMEKFHRPNDLIQLVDNLKQGKSNPEDVRSEIAVGAWETDGGGVCEAAAQADDLTKAAKQIQSKSIEIANKMIDGENQIQKIGSEPWLVRKFK